MADTNGVIELEALTKKIMFKSDVTEDEYFRYLQFVIDGVREINMFYDDKYLKYEKFTLDSLNSLDYPDDYIGFIALGIPINGRLWTFTEDKTLVVTTTEVGGEDTFDSEFGEGATVSQGLSGGYGSTGGTNTWYYKKVDSERKIYVNGSVDTQVILYYVSSGLNLNGETLISYQWAYAIEAYVLYELSKRDNEAINRQQLREDQYYTALRNAKMFDSWTIDTLLDTIRSTYKQTPHR